MYVYNIIYMIYYNKIIIIIYKTRTITIHIYIYSIIMYNSFFIYIYIDMWYVYRSVDAHKKHSEKAVYIILSSYLFESLLYLRKLIRSPDSSTRSPVAVAVQLGSAEDVSPKAQRRTACSSRRAANHTVFTLQRLGPVEFPFNILQPILGTSKWTAELFFIHCIELTKKKSWCSSPKCLSVPIFGQGSLQTVEQSSFERAPTARGHPPCQAVVLEWCLLNDLQLSTA